VFVLLEVKEAQILRQPQKDAQSLQLQVGLNQMRPSIAAARRRQQMIMKTEEGILQARRQTEALILGKPGERRE